MNTLDLQALDRFHTILTNEHGDDIAVKHELRKAEHCLNMAHLCANQRLPDIADQWVTALDQLLTQVAVHITARNQQ